MRQNLVHLSLLLAALQITTAATEIPVSFPGISLDREVHDFSESAWPPSPTGAVGPKHVLEMQNQSVAIYTRAGVMVKHVRLRDFLSATHGGFTYKATFDPRVIYDTHTDRWFAACVGFGSGEGALPDPVILAVSKTSDPTKAWSKLVLPVGEEPVGNDFNSTGNLTLGLDDNGVYLGVRIYPETASEFCKLVAMPKAPLLSGKLPTITQSAHISGLVASPMPAHNFDAIDSSTPAWFVASLDGAHSGLRMWRFSWNGPTPSFSLPINVDTAGYGTVPGAAQSGSALPLEIGEDRVQSVVIRNGSMWLSRTVGVNASGGAPSADRAASEWLELDSAQATPTVRQAGRVFDPNVSPRFYFQPVITANARGDMVLTFSGVRSSEFVGAYFSGRLVTDAANTTTSAQLLQAGEAAYERTVGDDSNPWGRHGAICVDSENDLSFWAIAPYAALTSTANSWGTRIARINLTTPPGVAKVRPVILNFGKVPVGRSRSKVFTITSASLESLIGTVNQPASPYVITEGAGDFSLPKGKRVRVKVTFTPTVTGIVAPTAIQIPVNDPTQAIISVNLTGTGK